LLSVNLVQKKHSEDLSKDITRKSAELKKKPQIDKILTVQNQLEGLTGLHAAKPAASRLLGYLNQLTPASISISDFTIDYTKQEVQIVGDADALSTVNKYVDTIKFTTYTAADTSADQAGGSTNTAASSTKTKAFDNVVLSSFGLNNSQDTGVKGKPAKYTIKLSYDLKIFDNTQTITLQVPNITTTRSSIDKPTDLFQAAPQQVTTGTKAKE
jgi:hypothetical protein